MVFIKRLIWDEWNIAHIERHDILPDEVDEICQGNPLIQQGHHGRIVLIGRTMTDKILEVVLDPEPDNGTYYVVTAHVASKKDRVLYRKEKRG